MPGANRHRPPSTRLLFNRVYRQQLEMEKHLEKLTAKVSDLGGRDRVIAVVVEHCRRLLAEKETLLKIIEANQFMAQELPRRPGGELRTLYDGFGLQHPVAYGPAPQKEAGT